MEKLQDLSQSELQELLDNPERVESMALESDEVKIMFYFPLQRLPRLTRTLSVGLRPHDTNHLKQTYHSSDSS